MTGRASSLSSSSSSESASTSSEIDFSPHDTTLLAIASVLYNHPPLRPLTPKHIAALRTYTPLEDASLSSAVTDVRTIRSETLRLIRRANEYDEYLNNQSEEQRAARSDNPINDFEASGWGHNEEVDPFEFGRYFRIWLFMKVMEREGESSQKQILLNGWAAYHGLPKEVKQEFGLLDSGGEDEEPMGWSQ